MGLFQYAISLVDPQGTREEVVMPWVDTGAMYCQFPASLLEGLGYRPNATRRFPMADGSQVVRPLGPINIRIGDEVQPIPCVYGPGDDTMMLLGAIALESFSLSADPTTGTLNPTLGMMLTMHVVEDNPQ